MPVRNSELIDKALVKALKAAEAPYQANRRAVKAIDIDGDVPKGDKELKLFLASVGAFSKELDGVENAANAVIRGISTGVH